MIRVGVVVEEIAVPGVEPGVDVPDDETVAPREQVRVVARTKPVLDHEELAEDPARHGPGHEQGGVGIEAGSPERDGPAPPGDDRGRDPIEHELGKAVVVSRAVHDIEVADAAQGADGIVVIIVVRDAEGVAGLVDDHARVERPVGVTRQLPLPGIIRQALPVQPVGRIPEPGVVTPPERGPLAAGPGPEDTEIVDGAVAVVVVGGEVVAQAVVVAQGLFDQVLAARARFRDRAPGVRGLVPAEDIARDGQLVVGGPEIEVAQAVERRIAHAIPEEPGDEIVRGRHARIVVERDEQSEDPDRPRRRHPGPCGRRRERLDGLSG